MAETEPFIKKGDPILGQAYEVPTSEINEWLEYLNALKGISARLVGSQEATEGMTEIFVSMSFGYDKPLDWQGRVGLPLPYAVTRRIRDSMRYALRKLDRTKELEK